MTYFAIGESTGEAGERRLGPFDTPEEAKAAGLRETKESNGGYVFRGVVDEANNQVFTDIKPVSTNAVVRNAVAANRRVAKNESLEYMIVIDFPNRREIIAPLFSSEWAATMRARDIAAKVKESVSVIHRPTGKTVWKNATANRRVARNATKPPFCNNYDVFLAIEQGDNPLNDFIKFEVREENAEMSRGEVPKTRMDLLERKMEKLLADAKRRVSNLTEGLNKLRSVK